MLILRRFLSVLVLIFCIYFSGCSFQSQNKIEGIFEVETAIFTDASGPFIKILKVLRNEGQVYVLDFKNNTKSSEETSLTPKGQVGGITIAANKLIHLINGEKYRVYGRISLLDTEKFKNYVEKHKSEKVTFYKIDVSRIEIITPRLIDKEIAKKDKLVEDNGNKIVIALEAYKKKTGKYPKILDELVPDYIIKIEPPFAVFPNWNYKPWEDLLGFELEFDGRPSLRLYGYYSKWKDWFLSTD